MKTASDYYNDPEFRAAAGERMRRECAEQGVPDKLTDPAEIAWLRHICSVPK
jgi:hypothetical protein